MSAPYFIFDAEDWISDLQLRGCSLAARGLWMELLCLMAENRARPGYLEINGRPITDPAEVARLTSGAPDEAAELLRELEQWGVFKRDERGCIFSDWMIEDVKRGKRSKKGGGK